VEFEAGNYEQAMLKLEGAATMSRAAADARGMAMASWWLAAVRVRMGQTEEGERLAHECLSIARPIGDPDFITGGLRTLAFARAWQGKYAESQRRVQEWLAVYNEVGLSDSIALTWLAYAALHQGQYAEARSHSQRALDWAKEAIETIVVGMALLQLGRVAVCKGAHGEARRLLLDSIAAYETVGWTEFAAESQSVLPYAALGLGDADEARRHLVEALRWTTERGSFPVLLSAFPVAGLLLLDQGEEERAVEIYATACTLPAVANSRWYEDVAGRPIAEAAAKLPAEVVAAAQERGRARDTWATAKELVVEFEAQVEPLTD
jgi:tetratricopeptide (TPR) repeat protein